MKSKNRPKDINKIIKEIKDVLKETLMLLEESRGRLDKLTLRSLTNNSKSNRGTLTTVSFIQMELGGIDYKLRMINTELTNLENKDISKEDKKRILRELDMYVMEQNLSVEGVEHYLDKAIKSEEDFDKNVLEEYSKEKDNLNKFLTKFEEYNQLLEDYLILERVSK